ncbi:AIPR family protein [Priestia megaterium]
MYPIQTRHLRDKLTGIYSSLIDVSDARPQNKENVFLTRALTAFALQSLTDITPEIAAKSITDGFGDNGLDAIFFDKDKNELYFIQSKWNHSGTKTPEDGEMKKFADGIRDITYFRFSHFNEKVKNQEVDIKKILSTPGIKLKVIITHTGIGISDHAQRTLNGLVEEQNIANGDTAEWINFDLEKLYKAVLGESVLDPINLNEVVLNEWAIKEKPNKSFYGRITGDQVASWWESYGDRLFAKNIRHLLSEGDVHKEISKTIESEPNNFWYYNNGITMICDTVKKASAMGDRRDIGIFKCENIHIINGAQTVGTIGKYAQKISDDQDQSGETSVRLEDIEVLIRIISVTEESETSDKFAQHLTKANNRQNRIENRDFITLDENQKRIAQELALYGINYNYKRSAEEKIEENTFGLVECTEALSYAYPEVDAATLMYREPSKVWENVEHSRYRRLFNTGVTSFFVWNTVNLYRLIKESIKQVITELRNEPEAILTHGDHFISHLIFKRIGIENIQKDEIGTEEAIKDININDLVRHYAIETAKEANKYGKTPQGLFKTFSIPREIVETIMSLDDEKVQNTHSLSIDSLLETKFINEKQLIKNRVSNFDEKISGNTLAEKGFFYWIDQLFNPDTHECGGVSNIHHYIKDEGNKDQRFILRLKYNGHLVIEFNHSSYGTDYVSLLHSQEKFLQWLSTNADEKGKFVIYDPSDIEKLQELKEFIEDL